METENIERIIDKEEDIKQEEPVEDEKSINEEEEESEANNEEMVPEKENNQCKGPKGLAQSVWQTERRSVCSVQNEDKRIGEMRPHG